VVVGLRLFNVDFPAPDVSFTYHDYTFTAAGACFNDCGAGNAAAGVRGNCYSASVRDALEQTSLTGPVCNCTSVGFRGYACGQEAVVSHIQPRSGPLQGGSLVTVSFVHLDLILGLVDGETDIKCRFGALPVSATVVSLDACVCLSPPLQRNGSVSLEVVCVCGRERKRALACT